MRPGHLQDLVNKIPRAHDLASAMNALNIMTNIITMINRSEPVVNNIGQGQGGGGVILKGEEIGEKYGPSDYVLESREYIMQKAINPSDNDQYIEIHCLKAVYFHNVEVNEHVNYFGEGSGLRMPGVAGD